MRDATLSRRGLVKAGLAAAAAFSLSRHARARAAPAEIKLPENIPVDRFDFEAKGIEGWTTVDGQWAVEDMAGAPSGKKVLVQRATKNEFNIIVAPPGSVSGRRRIPSQPLMTSRSVALLLGADEARHQRAEQKRGRNVISDVRTGRSVRSWVRYAVAPTAAPSRCSRERRWRWRS